MVDSTSHTPHHKLPADPDTCRAVRSVLESLWKNEPAVFRQLFLLEEIVQLEKTAAVTLLAGSLIELRPDGYRARVRIWPFDGRFYASDLFTSDAKDRVYPVYVDQGAFFAEHLALNNRDRVLDIGTGSGILAIEAARMGASAVGIDINARATEFATFNAALNDIRDVTFVTCGLDDYEVVNPFDLVLCNPPFTAVPEPDAWYLHGSAGYDGLDVFRGFLKRIPLAVALGGRVQVLLNSLGTATEIRALSLIREAFPDAGFEVRHLYDPPRKCIDAYTRCFQESPGYSSWCGWLQASGLTHVYRMLISVDLASTSHFAEYGNRGFRFQVIERFGTPPELASDMEVLGGWDEMLLRYGSRTRVTIP